MNESSEQEKARRARLRWINLGEAIAIAALIVSGLGLWHQWRKDETPAGPSTVVEKREPIPLTLRARPVDKGRALEITPVENSHALQSLTVTIAGKRRIEVGSDGNLDAEAVETALPDGSKASKDPQSVTAQIETRYVEMGHDKRSSGSYRLTYRWEGGGLFGGRSLRLVSLSR